MEQYFSSEQIEIYSSWETINGKRINNAVYLVKDADKCKLEVESVVSAERCVLLKSKDDSEPETLYMAFKAPAQQLISGISVISEARHLEIYSHLDEYVTTVRSFLLDDFDEDFVAYRSEAEFAHPLNGCRIKFLSLRDPARMWFYGAILHISERIPTVAPSSSFGISANVGGIITRLEEEGLQLSDGAKSLAKLLKDSNAGTPASLPMLLALLGRQAEAEQPPTIRSTPNSGQKEYVISSTSSCDEAMSPRSAAEQNEDIASSESQLVEEDENIGISYSVVQTLIQESEDRLWTKLKKHMMEQEQRQNEKLDRILTLLEGNKGGNP